MAGIFITFEGIDGSGKSTQMRMLTQVLRSRGLEVIQTREPGGTSFGKRLRSAILDLHEHVDPLAELLLFAADRAQHVRTLVRPAIEAGHIVLSDRYADATRAYQGAGRGFSTELIDEVIELATDGLRPDLTLIFDLPVAECVARAHRRTHDGHKGDRLDSEDADFHTRVREAYLEIARREPERVRVIDASGTIDETQARVMDVVMRFIKSRI